MGSVLFCLNCESEVIDYGGWLTCYCDSAEKGDEESYPESWHYEGQHPPYDTLEEKWL